MVAGLIKREKQAGAGADINYKARRGNGNKIENTKGGRKNTA